MNALYLLALLMAVGSASCTPPPPPITFIKSGSYVENKGHASALSGNAEQAYSTPSYSGSHGVSGSYVTTGTDSYGLAKGYSQAATEDFKGATLSDLESFAVMGNDHFVPSSDTATKYLSVANSGLPYSASAGRDVVLNTPHSAGAVSEAGASTAASNVGLVNKGWMQGATVKLPTAFPEDLITGVPKFDINLGRKLLTAPMYKPSFALSAGGSNGTAHGTEAFALGGSAAASFDSPFAQGSVADSLDYVHSGGEMGSAAASTKAYTNTPYTDAESQTFAFMNTKWYEPMGKAAADINAMASGEGGYDLSNGRDVSIVTPHFAGAAGGAEGFSSHSDKGLQADIATTLQYVLPFKTTWIDELRG